MGKNIAYVFKNDMQYFRWCLKNIEGFNIEETTNLLRKKALWNRTFIE